MDEENNQNVSLDHVSKLIAYMQHFEKSSIEYINNIKYTRRAKNATNKEKEMELQQLKTERIEQYRLREFGELHTLNLRDGINTFDNLSVEINRRLSGTSQILETIEASRAVVEDKLRNKHIQLEENKRLKSVEIESLQEELNGVTVELKEATEMFVGKMDDYQKEIEEIEVSSGKEVIERKSFVEETSDLEQPLTLGKNDLEEMKEKCVNLDAEVQELTVESSKYEDILNDHKTSCEIQQEKIKNLNDEQMSLKETFENIQREIVFVEGENDNLRNHEIFFIEKHEQEKYTLLMDKIAVEIQEFEKNIISIEYEIQESKAKEVILKKEFMEMESQINNCKQSIIEIDQSIGRLKTLNNETLIEGYKEKVKTIETNYTSTITEIVELNKEMYELDIKTRILPSVTVDDINAINYNKKRVVTDTKSRVKQLEINYEHFVTEEEKLREEALNRLTRKLNFLKESLNQVDQEIKRLADEEKIVSIGIEAQIVKYDMFARKLQAAKSERKTLIKKINEFRKPTVSAMRPSKRSADGSDLNVMRLTSVQNCINYKKAKMQRWANKK